MRKFIFIFFLLINTITFSQVKVGNNPSLIHDSSILELESTDKVLVITRMTEEVMNLISPLQGALVYNTTDDCVYSYDGTNWNSLCEGSGGTTTVSHINVLTSPVAPTSNTEGDFWINSNNNNNVSVWDGDFWIPIDTNPRKGNGVPTTTTAPNPNPGDVYVDESTGSIYAYDGTNWINSNASLSANNGVYLDTTTNTVQLGGALTLPTTITTDATNTLAITGLQDTNTTTDQIVTINPTSGVLTKTNVSNLFSLTEEVTRITADDGDLQFTPNIDLNTSVKVEVYRNGVRVDYTIVNNTTIEIEPEAECYAGDQIKIVQLY